MPAFIDLSIKPKEVKEASREPSVYYPSLHIVGEADTKLPEEGTAIIKFRKGDSGTRKRDGKTEYYCDIEVLGIKPSGDSMPAKKRSFGESLDRAVAKREEASGEDEEDDYED